MPVNPIYDTFLEGISSRLIDSFRGAWTPSDSPTTIQSSSDSSRSSSSSRGPAMDFSVAREYGMDYDAWTDSASDTSSSSSDDVAYPHREQFVAVGELIPRRSQQPPNSELEEEFFAHNPVDTPIYPPLLDITTRLDTSRITIPIDNS